jgi:Tfp pilus assembly protein PilV
MRSRFQRGATLIEAVVAMGVLMVGAAGLVGLQRQGTFFMGDSRRTTRAAAFAQDLANQIELWDYTDPRLANADTANDADIGDAAFQFEQLAAPPADHGEADLTLGGTTWTGLPSDLLEANGMQRYWNVSYPDDYNGNGIPDAARVAVIVRWQHGSGWRRTVFMVTKVNPGDLR